MILANPFQTQVQYSVSPHLSIKLPSCGSRSSGGVASEFGVGSGPVTVIVIVVDGTGSNCGTVSIVVGTGEHRAKPGNAIQQQHHSF